ncbi:hypothetical protein MFUM_790004 [Methylacidiphilum fumariolicum SolV]|uniref:Uncharacterized protein n=2 Tax=Candidatus Methylacidiphilum fumarolicum TaxID=591154 RepID=I0JZT3_METFB|nr:conserved protein of unknown function [Candidatus Methylacidiphilum fumarolicum]CCG92752.1 hypothetical protein MFUM_790004 [Methylacidiphilum fumariolicum SolV]
MPLKNRLTFLSLQLEEDRGLPIFICENKGFAYYILGIISFYMDGVIMNIKIINRMILNTLLVM